MQRDEVYLLDMLIAARRATAHADGADFEDLENDQMLQDAVIRCLGLVGEGAARVSLEYRSHHPEIDWRDVIGMRNRLVHDYRHVDLGIVWRTLTQNLPRLIKALESLISPADAV